MFVPDSDDFDRDTYCGILSYFPHFLMKRLSFSQLFPESQEFCFGQGNYWDFLFFCYFPHFVKGDFVTDGVYCMTTSNVKLAQSINVIFLKTFLLQPYIIINFFTTIHYHQFCCFFISYILNTLLVFIQSTERMNKLNCC